MSEASFRTAPFLGREAGELCSRVTNDSGESATAAAGSDREANDDAIDGFRIYLLTVAERSLTPELKTKEGASDVVQETLVEAHRIFHRFEGRSQEALRAWLRQLLKNRVAHAARRYRGTEKRRLGRELSLDAGLAGHDLDLALSADHTSPGGRAERGEEEAALISALGRLPDKMRQAVLGRHHEHCTFDELGRRLGCSNVAARKLWLRALERLQRELTGKVGTALRCNN
jgi:RNA polymerase sigma-70 factor (ECF subfamily)